jgi:hypothetical protein
MRMVMALVMIAGVTMLGSAQTVKAPPLNYLADSVTPGPETRLHGHVRIAACSIVTADEAVLHTATNEIDLSGKVRMKLTHGVDPLKVR